MLLIETIFKNTNGSVIHGDNLDVLTETTANSVDSCISDFPYALSFMGKKWDTINNFYAWSRQRSDVLYRVIKPGGYVAIFGHPKTNHRMKCAFEDSGFRIVDEVDWIYLTGLPKGQDIAQMFANADCFKRLFSKCQGNLYGCGEESLADSQSEFVAKWQGWKTAGLKPAHEPITIFQKPLDGTYIENIAKHGCGGMHIDACRVPIGTSEGDASFAKDLPVKYPVVGRFPANVIMDEFMAMLLDVQTGEVKSTGGKGIASRINRTRNIYGAYQDKSNAEYMNDSLGGYGDTGGGSRLFTIIKYCSKVSPSERKLPCGDCNPHLTVKPVELFKWLIKLLTPIDGVTIDITAGSGTHGVAAEELNKTEGYALKWLDIELSNSETDPYCNIAAERIKAVWS